ncbi:MAG: protease complex subunit PrcB family protein [Clostridia bacterium]|nr:protease complex subunit PrcB family protein [Clostridia bacterium]
MNKKRKILFLGVLAVVLMIGGCKAEITGYEKVSDLNYTVMNKDEIPEDLAAIIEEKKENIFKFTYSDQQFLYIVIGYGMQESGGYDIQIRDLYLTSNAIFFDTELIGPKKADETMKGSSYPYLVVKTELMDQRVIFE